MTNESASEKVASPGGMPQHHASGVAAPLPYGRRSALRLRRIWRVALTLLVAVAAIAGINWGPALYRQASYLYWQRQCMKTREPDDRLVFESDPVLAARMVAGDGRYHFPVRTLFERQGPPRGWGPPAYYRPSAFERAAIPHSIGVDGVAFLRGIRPPGETERLAVCLIGCGPTEVDGRYLCVISMSLWALASWKPGSVVTGGRNSSSVLVWVLRGERLRIYAGQLDPADASHVTIPYEINGVRGTIDGRIAASGIPELTIRDGPASKRTYDTYRAQDPPPVQSPVEAETHLALLKKILDNPGNRSAAYLRNVREDAKRTRELIDQLRQSLGPELKR
jgi:hypothetical protein